MANCAGPHCGRGRALDLDVLIAKFGPDYCVINETRIAAACRCDRCGHKGAIIHRMANVRPNGYRKAKDG